MSEATKLPCLEKIKIATLKFPSLQLRKSEITLMRGYIGNLFKEHDLIHNHREDGSVYYRYPLIQFKIIDRIPVLIAITEKAVEIFIEIFMKLNEIQVGEQLIPVYEKDIQLQNCEWGFSEKMAEYEFISPWLALNQENYAKFEQLSLRTEKSELLQKTLIGNTLSLIKGLGGWLSTEQRLTCELNVRPQSTRLKGNYLIGWRGSFKINFVIPNYLGIGKSVSRGFGTVIKKAQNG